MLVLSRQRDETIVIGDDIEVTVVDIRGDKVRLGITAPRTVSVHRKEVYEAIRRENRAAAQVNANDLPPVVAPPQLTLPGPLLPQPRAAGDYRWPDGSAVYRAVNVRGKWRAHWADRTPLRGDNDETSFFDSAELAAAALAAGGEGPAAVAAELLVKGGVV